MPPVTCKPSVTLPPVQIVSGPVVNTSRLPLHDDTKIWFDVAEAQPVDGATDAVTLLPVANIEVVYVAPVATCEPFTYQVILGVLPPLVTLAVKVADCWLQGGLGLDEMLMVAAAIAVTTTLALAVVLPSDTVTV